MPFCGPSGPACVRAYSPHPCTSCCVGSRTPQMGHIRGLAMSGVWLLVAKTSAGLVRGPPDLDPEVLDLDPPNGSRIHGSRVFLCWSVRCTIPFMLQCRPFGHTPSIPWYTPSRIPGFSGPEGPQMGPFRGPGRIRGLVVCRRNLRRSGPRSSDLGSRVLDLTPSGWVLDPWIPWLLA